MSICFKHSRGLVAECTTDSAQEDSSQANVAKQAGACVKAGKAYIKTVQPDNIILVVVCVFSNDHLVVATHHGQVVWRSNGVDVTLVVPVSVGHIVAADQGVHLGGNEIGIHLQLVHTATAIPWEPAAQSSTSNATGSKTQMCCLSVRQQCAL